MMKKKLITIVMGMVFWAGLFGGCGQTEVKQDNAITNSSEEGKEEGTAEEKELTGTIDENHCILAGQTGINGHVKIADNVILGGKTGGIGKCQQWRYCNGKIYRNNF